MGTEHTEARPAPLRGYRVLSDEEKAMLDRIKLAEEEIGKLWAEAYWRFSKTMDASISFGEARNLFRQGFMELLRGVARPRDPYGEALRAVGPGNGAEPKFEEDSRGE